MSSIKTMKLDHLNGQNVGTSILLKELDRGGMAAIFIAYQKSLKRQIAVKILPKSLLSASTAEFFQREAESAAILSHPNIIPIYEVGDMEEFLFFTMQLVKGESLSYYIKKARKNVIPSKRFLPLPATLRIIMEVLDALEYAHAQDIVHRDIKPANILMERHTKRPIITDFGVAKVTRDASDSDEESSMLLGTPIYMAPEQIIRDDVDGRADIYATGTMLFEMLVSKLPFPDIKSAMELLKNKLELKDRLFKKRPSQINKAVSKNMDEIVLKAVSFDKERRYATCKEFLEHLKWYQKRYTKR